jgi:spermidine/putrescine transport system permease protein
MKFLRKNLGLIALLLPGYGWMILAVYIPLLMMLVFSFLSKAPIAGQPFQFTLGNYADYFSKGFYWTLTRKALLTGLYTTLICLVLAYPMSYAIAKVVPGRWRSALFMLVIVPFWSNTVVRLYSWAIVLRNGGVLDLLAQKVGLPAGSFDILFSYTAILVGLVHGYIPYMVLTLYVAMDRIDDSLLEAAASLGANKLQAFLRVTFPLSMPGVLSGAILIFIPVIGSFVEPRLLGGRSGTMIGTVIEDQFIQLFNWPFGAALAFILLTIVLLIMAVSAKALSKTQLLSSESGQ